MIFIFMILSLLSQKYKKENIAISESFLTILIEECSIMMAIND